MSDVHVIVHNRHVVSINGKYVVRTGRGVWIRQMSVMDDEEIKALHETIKNLPFDDK